MSAILSQFTQQQQLTKDAAMCFNYIFSASVFLDSSSDKQLLMYEAVASISFYSYIFICKLFTIFQLVNYICDVFRNDETNRVS